MHRMKGSASPYIFRIELDSCIPFLDSDLKKFKASTNQGVAVYGYTPNIMILCFQTYEHWDSLDNLLSSMVTGKLGICSDQDICSFLSKVEVSHPRITVQKFSAESECKRWLCE